LSIEKVILVSRLTEFQSQSRVLRKPMTHHRKKQVASDPSSCTPPLVPGDTQKACVVDIILESDIDETSSLLETSPEDLQFLTNLSAKDFLELLETDVTETDVSAAHAICIFSVASLQTGLKASHKENTMLQARVLALEEKLSSCSPPPIVHSPPLFHSPSRLPPLLPTPLHLRPLFPFHSNLPPLLTTPSTLPFPSLQMKRRRRRTKKKVSHTPPSERPPHVKDPRPICCIGNRSTPHPPRRLRSSRSRDVWIRVDDLKAYKASISCIIHGPIQWSTLRVETFPPCRPNHDPHGHHPSL
jgi:hypothetical protein